MLNFVIFVFMDSIIQILLDFLLERLFGALALWIQLSLIFILVPPWFFLKFRNLMLDSTLKRKEILIKDEFLKKKCLVG